MSKKYFIFAHEDCLLGYSYIFHEKDFIAIVVKDVHFTIQLSLDSLEGFSNLIDYLILHPKKKPSYQEGFVNILSNPDDEIVCLEISNLIHAAASFSMKKVDLIRRLVEIYLSISK